MMIIIRLLKSQNLHKVDLQKFNAFEELARRLQRNSLLYEFNDEMRIIKSSQWKIHRQWSINSNYYASKSILKLNFITKRMEIHDENEMKWSLVTW